ncbi:hypothetical protein [Kineococcus sp. NPDC059986]|uniref:hypothetical protein n=1 Tax=Kineococcus sp. NPDC059986 TaxID=3155538 RepID=UPI003450D5B0
MTTWPAKATVGGDVGVWGDKINAIFDALFASQDGDQALFVAIAKELTDARGNYASLALRLAAAGLGVGTVTTPTGTKNTYLGAGNTYAAAFNRY